MNESAPIECKEPGRRARQLQERRSKLVRAARSLLEAKPNGEFSMLELAKKAGFSPATPYNLFGTKGALLAAVYEAEIRGFQKALLPLLDDDPVIALLETAEHIARQFTKRGDFYRSFAASMKSLAMDDVRPVMIQLNEAMLSPLVGHMAARNAFERWIAPSFLTSHLTRQLEAVFAHWASGEWSPEQLAAELRFGFGMAVLGAVRSAHHAALRKVLKAAVIEIQQSAEARPSESA